MARLTSIRGAILALLLISAASVRADVVHLNTGGVVKGDIVAETEQEVRIKNQAGATISVFREDIARIERGASAADAYKEGLKKLKPDDAEGHYQLGAYLRKLRLEKEARECFARALKIDPAHLLAKIALQEAEASKEALVASGDGDGAGAGGETATPVRGKLPPEQAKALEAAKRGTRAAEAEARAAGWEAIRALYAAALPEGREAIVGAVLPLEAAPRRVYERNAKRLAQAIPDYGPDQRKSRDAYREAWEGAVKVALDTIFDLKIYPDENHGKVGQPIVDEKVKAVRKVYPGYDQLIAHDVARFAAMTEEQAKGFVSALERSRTLTAEALAGLGALGVDGLRPLPEEPAPVTRALLLHRAGRIEEAWAFKGHEDEKLRLSPWEVRLLERLRDQRVEGYNDRLLSDKAAPEKGKRPNGEERKQVAITNQYRMLMGREALEIHPCLVESARGHSLEMTQLGYFAHESPVEKNKTPSDRAKNAGYEHGAAENISLGSTPPQATHDAWYNSSGHHRNILGEGHKAMGSGLDGQHWTQNFGGVGLLAR